MLAETEALLGDNALSSLQQTIRLYELVIKIRVDTVLLPDKVSLTAAIHSELTPELIVCWSEGIGV